MRDITVVIDQIVGVAPDLLPVVNPIKVSADFTAPEAQHRLWVKLCSALTDHAENHPKQVEIQRILSGADVAKKLVCFDIEATGVDTAKDRVVQIAFCEITACDEVSGELIASNRRKLLINPGVNIPAEATAIHGITNDDVYGSPTFRDVSLVLHDQFKDCDLAGFNVSNFDVPLLWEEFYRVGIEWDLSETRIIDAGTLFKRREERTLAAALQFYCGRELVDAHDAMNDVLATVDVLTAQIDRYKLSYVNRETLERESNYEEKRVDLAGKIIVGKDGRPTWNFGKVKGKAVVDELGFAYWVLDKDFSENTKGHLRRIIDEHNSEIVQDSLSVDGEPF